MSMKATDRPVQPFHYDPEDLEPRDAMLDDAAVDAYLERNKDALNVSIERAEAEYERGEYLTLDQVRAALDAQLEKIRGEQA